MTTTKARRARVSALPHPEGMRLMFAYGANTNLANMRHRCPAAVPLCSGLLPGWRLVFRGVADVVEQPGAEVFGALWWITEECERALDRYEGFPNLYVKREVPVRLGGKRESAMLYVMRAREWCDVPSGYYEHTLRVGYREFGLPQLQIDEAIARARQSSRARAHRREGREFDEELWGSPFTREQGGDE